MPDFIAVLITTRRALALLCGLSLAGQAIHLSAQPVQNTDAGSLTPEALVSQLPNINESSERWYQIEITLFLHSFYNPEEEAWQGLDTLTAASTGSTRLLSLTELLSLPEWTESEEEDPALSAANQQRQAQNRRSRPNREPIAIEAEEMPEPLIDGPEVAHQSNFRIPDPQTDGFITLLPEDWNFSETNRALQRSPNYRVLFHSAWRQPMRLANATQDIVIEGGRQVDEHHELEGTLRFYFNNRRDRIILDNQLLLNIWGTTDNVNTRNSSDAARGGITEIVQRIPVMTTRELRSNEFHYLDHPVVGALVEVFPYELEASE